MRSHSLSGYRTKQDDCVSMLTTMEPALISKSDSRWRAGTDNRPFASRLMCCTPLNTTNLHFASKRAEQFPNYPLFPTYHHFNNRGVAGQCERKKISK